MRHRRATWVLGLLLDTLILLMLALTTVIALTGGGVIDIGSVRIRARTADNPIWILSVLIIARYAGRNWAPALGVHRWPIEVLVERGRRLALEEIPNRAVRLLATPLRGLGALALAAGLVKLLIAWTSPGFFSGDDVEVHEMSLAALFGVEWPVWELRSAFFPMLVVYPAQRLAAWFGATSPETLVFFGRAAVALLSTLTIPLTWMAARRAAPGDPRVAALAVLFLVVNKLQMSFGSSELPRPVSTVFVLAAFLVLLRGRLFASALGGALLGTAAAFRFSEVMFLLPAILTLRPRRRLANAAVLIGAAGITLIGITAAADALYWGHPLASLAAAIDYTLVRGESSRGYQPPWEYARVIPAWTTFLFAGLAVAGSGRRYTDTWWTWIPLLLLSLLPHKESRYLIPIIPFLSIGVARGFLRTADWIRQSAAAVGWRRWGRDLFAPALLLAFLHEVGGWRLIRSNEGIRLTEYLDASGASGIAAEEIWRLGGRPYLRHHHPLVALPSGPLDESSVASAVANTPRVALRTPTAQANGDAVMASLGFERDRAWNGGDYVLYVRRGR